MVGIKVRGEFLDTWQVSFSFELKSPAYFGDDTDVIEGSIMFNTKIPLSDHNAILLKTPDIITQTTPLLVNEYCEIWAQGSILFAGELTVTEATNIDISIEIIINSISKLKEIGLNEVEYDAFTVTNLENLLAFANASASNPDSTLPFIFTPIWNPLQYGEETEESKFADASFQNIWEETDFKVYEGSTLTPFLKVSYVLKKAIESVGFTLNNAFQNTPELRWMIIYNNYSLVTSLGALVSTSIDWRNHVSSTKVSDFMKRLCRFWNLGIFTNYFSKTVEIIPLDTILSDAPRHNWTKAAIKGYTKSEKRNYPNRFSNDSYGLALPSDWHNQKRYDHDVVLSTDPTGLYLNTEGQWIYFVGADVQAEMIKVELNNFVEFTEGSVAFSTPFGHMPQCRAFMHGKLALMPAIRLKAQIDGTVQEFDDTILFYRGFTDTRRTGVTFVNGQLYPLSSQEDVDMFGNVIKTGWDSSALTSAISTPGFPAALLPTPCQRSMMWKGAKGVYQKSWATWRSFLTQKKDVTMSLKLTVEDIRTFSFAHKVTIFNMVYLVKKMTISPDVSGEYFNVKAELATVV